MPSRADAPNQPPLRPAPHRRARRRVSAAAILAVLAGDALAVLGTTTYDYYPDSASAYAAFAATCPIATGAATACGDNTTAKTWDALKTTVLFAWGPADADIGQVGNNGAFVWKNELKGGVGNSETYDVRITGINLIAKAPIGTAPGTDPAQGQNTIGQQQGLGVTGAWEALGSTASPGALVGDVRIQVVNNWSNPLSTKSTWYAPTPDTAAGKRLIADSSLETTPWVDFVNHTTVQTPLVATATPRFTNELTSVQNTIIPNNDIQVRFFTTNQLGDGSYPSAVLGPTQLEVFYSRANLQALDLDFGQVRVGTTSAAQGASIRNLTDTAGGLRALNVLAGTPGTGAAFQASGGQAIGRLDPVAAGYNTNASYTYTPTGLLSGDQPYQQELAIAVTSNGPTALPRNDALSTSFLVKGEAVGPIARATPAGGVADLGSVWGGSEVPGTTVNFGSIEVGQSLTRELTFSNIFGVDSDGLTDLTLQMIWGSDYKIYYQLAGLGDTEIHSGVDVDRAISAQTDLMFKIVFTPTVTGLRDTSLLIWTDMNRPLGDVVAESAGSTYFKFNLTGSGSQQQAPVPGTLALLGLGFAALRWRRGS